MNTVLFVSCAHMFLQHGYTAVLDSNIIVRLGALREEMNEKLAETQVTGNYQYVGGHMGGAEFFGFYTLLQKKCKFNLSIFHGFQGFPTLT